MREETRIQRSIVEALGVFGIRTLHTSAFTAKGPIGTAKGVPDLLCFTEDAPGLMWGLEVKTAKGKPTPEQKALSEAGAYSIVRTPWDALSATREVLERYAPDCKAAKRLARARDLGNRREPPER